MTWIAIFIIAFILAMLVIGPPIYMAGLKAWTTAREKQRKINHANQQAQIMEARIARENNAVLLQDIEIENRIAEGRITMLRLEELLERRGVRDFTPLDYPSAGPSLAGPESEPTAESPRTAPSAKRRGRTRKR